MKSFAADTSVVICCHTEKRWSDIKRAVRSVVDQSCPPAEILLVVDHNEVLFERARREFHDVRAIANTFERGLAGARNTGVDNANGSIVAFLDDDAWAEQRWLERLTSWYTDENVLGVGGQITPEWKVTPPRWFPDEFRWVIGCSYAGLPNGPAPVRNMIGANMSSRRDVLQNVGNFRIGLGRVGFKPMGCEETEFCIRAAAAHRPGRFWFDPSAIVHHTVPADRATWSYFKARCQAEGQSKSQIVTEIGGEGTASERHYVTKTLPRAIAHDLACSLATRSIDGVLQAAAIVGGTALVGGSYFADRLRKRTMDCKTNTERTPTD